MYGSVNAYRNSGKNYLFGSIHNEINNVCLCGMRSGKRAKKIKEKKIESQEKKHRVSASA